MKNKKSNKLFVFLKTKIMIAPLVLSTLVAPVNLSATEFETQFEFEFQQLYMYSDTYGDSFNDWSDFDVDTIIQNAKAVYENHRPALNARVSIQPHMLPPFLGSGTPANPFIITTAQEFINLSRYSSGMQSHAFLPVNFFNNAVYVMLFDIDLNFSTDFVPIGLHQVDGFTGMFIGANRTISNILVDFDRTISPFTTGDLEAVGIFSHITNAEIHSLNIDNLHVNVLGQSRNNIGGLAGYASGADTRIANVNMRNVSINAEIANRVGGLVGSAIGITVNGVRFDNLNLIGGDHTGGIVGFIHNDTTIARSYVNGEIRGNNNVGGIFGSYNEDDTRSITIHSNYSRANITGNNDVGGIGGFSRNTRTDTQALNTRIIRNISNNYTAGHIVGNQNVGGIIGRTSGNMGELGNNWSPNAISNSLPHTFIVDNYSLAQLSGNQNVGGIIGSAVRHIHVERNYVYNEINQSNGNIGGLIGALSGTHDHINSRVGVVVQNNLVMSRITALSTANASILIGNLSGGVTISNNYFGSHSHFMGGVTSNFDHAAKVFNLELQSPGWWSNVLLINQNNAFDISRVQQGLLPFVRGLGGTTPVSDQTDIAFSGNQNIIVNPILPHAHGHSSELHISIEADGNSIQGIEFIGIPVYISQPELWLDYTPFGQEIILHSSFMAGLPIGEHRVHLVLTGGTRMEIIVSVIPFVPDPPEFEFFEDRNWFVRSQTINTVVASFGGIEPRIVDIVNVHGLTLHNDPFDYDRNLDEGVTSVNFINISIFGGFTTTRKYYDFLVNFDNGAVGAIRIYVVD